MTTNPHHEARAKLQTRSMSGFPPYHFMPVAPVIPANAGIQRKDDASAPNRIFAHMTNAMQSIYWLRHGAKRGGEGDR